MLHTGVTLGLENREVYDVLPAFRCPTVKTGGHVPKSAVIGKYHVGGWKNVRG
jgi:hypothetical protein